MSIANNLNSNYDTLSNCISKWNDIKNSNSINYTELVELNNLINTTAVQTFENLSRTGRLKAEKDLVISLKQYITDIKGILNKKPSKTDKKLSISFQNLAKSKKKEIINHLNQNLLKLEKEINLIDRDLALHGMIVRHFEEDISTFGHLSIGLKKFISNFINSFKLSEYLKGKINRYLFTPPSSLKKKEHLNKSLDKAKLEMSNLNKQHETLSKKIEKKPNNKVLTLKLKNLNKLIEKKSKDLKQIEKKCKKIEGSFKKGHETKLYFHQIGGENIKIHATDDKNTVLDGVYLPVDNFRKTLKENGAQIFKLNHLIDGRKIETQGFSFSKDEFQNSKLEKILTVLGAFPTDERYGAGWTKIEYNDQILLVRDEDVEKLELENLIEDSKLIENEELDVSLEDIDLTKSSDGATVVLTVGNAGVYEMYKKEMFSHLLRGNNVLAFNFRGYGESSGTSSENGFNKDMEVVHSYLKTVHQTPDEKILLKALCMSGGPATKLAGKNPNLNLLLDQTYADFRKVIHLKAKEEIPKYVEKEYGNVLKHSKIKRMLWKWVSKNLDKLSRMLANYLAPSWMPKEEINKVKGNICLLYTTNDKTIEFNSQTLENYKAVLNSGKAKKISLYNFPGLHADSWLEARDKIWSVKPVDNKKLQAIIEKHEKVNASLKSENNPFIAVSSNLLEDLTKEYYSSNPEINLNQEELINFLFSIKNKLQEDDTFESFSKKLENLPYFNKNKESLSKFLKEIIFDREVSFIAPIEFNESLALDIEMEFSQKGTPVKFDKDELKNLAFKIATELGKEDDEELLGEVIKLRLQEKYPEDKAMQQAATQYLTGSIVKKNNSLLLLQIFNALSLNIVDEDDRSKITYTYSIQRLLNFTRGENLTFNLKQVSSKLETMDQEISWEDVEKELDANPYLSQDHIKPLLAYQLKKSMDNGDSFQDSIEYWETNFEIDDLFNSLKFEVFKDIQTEISSDLTVSSWEEIEDKIKEHELYDSFPFLQEEILSNLKFLIVKRDLKFAFSEVKTLTKDNPDDIEKNISTVLKKYYADNPQIHNQLRNFLYETFQVQNTELIESEPKNSVFVGRRVVDEFLRSAKLQGNLYL